MSRIFQINLSDGGVPKRPVSSANLTPLGLEGDRQRDLRYHGGPERAVCVYSLERILALQAEGHPIFPGSTGETVTTVGLDWDNLALGARLQVGKVEIELTDFAVPCRNIAASFAEGKFKRISEPLHPKWSRIYARVLTPGVLQIGDAVVLL